MAKISIIFTAAHLVDVKAGAKLIGKHVLADNFVGPEFENASIEPSGLDGLLLIKPDDRDVAYLYPTQHIARIRIEKVKERTTDSGIVIVKPDVVVPKR